MKLLQGQVMGTSKQGLVFSIQRFAVHDGAGLRTTVFLKGCNLRCTWCQNPEGLTVKRDVIVSNTKCIRCQRCQQIDTEGVIIDTDGYKRILNKEKVSYEKYIDNCPSGAIVYDSTYYTVEELIEIVLKDKVFFREGGGVTLSGGEALLQLEFVIDFFKQCQEVGINTALETALHIPTKHLQKVLPYVDTLYCDLKEINNDKHQQFTNCNNTLILSNIRYVLSSEYAHKVIIRTPLIPNHTATYENIKGISKYIASIYTNVHYELLNYNPLAVSKYIELNEGYCLDSNTKRYTKEEMEAFRVVARENGVRYVR